MKKIYQCIIKFKTKHPELYNVITRALWTFAQATLAAIVIAPGVEWKSMIIGAIGAGLSAVKTVIVDAMQKRALAKDEGDA